MPAKSKFTIESAEGKSKLKTIFINMKKVYKTLNEKKKKNPVQLLLFLNPNDEQTITKKAKETMNRKSKSMGARVQRKLDKEKKMDNNSTVYEGKSVEKCSKYQARASAYDHPNDSKINMYIEPLKAASKGADSSYDHPNDKGKMLLGMPKKGKGKKKKATKAKKKTK